MKLQIELVAGIPDVGRPNRVRGADIPREDGDGLLVYLSAGGAGFILAREGDPVDLNGNGIFDDNAFIDTFGNDDGVLSGKGQFYFVATLQDAGNTTIGQAYLTLAVPEPATTVFRRSRVASS